MSYVSQGGRPFEHASRSSHHHLINDPVVQQTLNALWIPTEADTSEIGIIAQPFEPVGDLSTTHVLAVDGGYTEVVVKKDYPSATLHFFQFGALLLALEDLRQLEETPFPFPEDVAKLNNIERLKLALPTRGMRDRSQPTLKASMRRHIYEFFRTETLGESRSLLDTLAWFIFRRYKGSSRNETDRCWHLASHPCNPDLPGPDLHEHRMTQDYRFQIDGHEIFLTDVLRLHEIIDEETGGAGICPYLAGAIEHLIVIHIIRHLLQVRPSALRQTFFILDRPTGFFGQTARLHVPMLDLVKWLFANHDLYLAGLEKSGSFVDHAHHIAPLLKDGSFIVLDDAYIYRHISPGREDPSRPYASTSYYGHKVIFKSRFGQMHVVSIPVTGLKKFPQSDDLPHLGEILTLVESLRCSMYDSALVPVSLANKLVSLAAHPSTRILEQFAISKVERGREP